MLSKYVRSELLIGPTRGSRAAPDQRKVSRWADMSGDGGIRTRERFDPQPAWQAGALGHYATSPVCHHTVSSHVRKDNVSQDTDQCADRGARDPYINPSNLVYPLTSFNLWCISRNSFSRSGPTSCNGKATLPRPVESTIESEGDKRTSSTSAHSTFSGPLDDFSRDHIRRSFRRNTAGGRGQNRKPAPTAIIATAIANIPI